MFHPLNISQQEIPLPALFTYPFRYTPHPLSVMAANEVQKMLSGQRVWQHELKEGKMFGVLIVRSPQGKIGFLAAFSGLLAGSYHHPYFVPPIYDLQQPDDFFKKEEATISLLNKQITALENDPAYINALKKKEESKLAGEQAIQASKQALKIRKQIRQEARKNEADTVLTLRLNKESQFEKAEHKRLEAKWKQRIKEQEQVLARMQQTIQQLKQERKQRSNTLQKQIFDAFVLLNAKGEQRNLNELFQHTAQRIPPAGAGECAAPKLLQHAFLHNFQPLAMAEFWWGGSPTNALRQHGMYYPACTGKCGPILTYMLQGLSVEPDPMSNRERQHIQIVYEDAWIVIINKPSGLLSVPGKDPSADSAYQQLKELYPQAEGPLLVHRLDMDTSGLLLAAKDLDSYRFLQAQFADHTIRKRYTALLAGNLPISEGIIDLPICPDLTDRPRQQVNFQKGKVSQTRFSVLGHNSSATKVAFYPLTGRTHQLRLHAAHPQGLHTPILGDALYGQPAERLYLHAAEITFIHPQNHQTMTICQEADF